MQEYDPLSAPASEDWLGLDESERLNLVLEYHREIGEELPRETLQRLMVEGLDRHTMDAIHAIGSVLVEHMWEIQKSGDETTWSNEAYFDDLRLLTAQKWLDQFR